MLRGHSFVTRVIYDSHSIIQIMWILESVWTISSAIKANDSVLVILQPWRGNTTSYVDLKFEECYIYILVSTSSVLKTFGLYKSQAGIIIYEFQFGCTMN